MSRVVDLAMASLNERAFADRRRTPPAARPAALPLDDEANAVARDVVASVLGRVPAPAAAPREPSISRPPA
jgi:hypothetical protein